MSYAFTPVVGANMRLYRNTGTAGTPVWVLVSQIGDLNISDLTRALAEIKRRASVFTTNLAALIQSISIELKYWYGLDSTNFTALRTNMFSGAIEQWAMMDGDITVTGTQGLKIPVVLEQFPISQNLEDPVSIDVVAKTGYWESPAGTPIDPAWFAVP